jgi:hypothetical protein
MESFHLKVLVNYLALYVTIFKNFLKILKVHMGRWDPVGIEQETEYYNAPYKSLKTDLNTG